MSCGANHNTPRRPRAQPAQHPRRQGGNANSQAQGRRQAGEAEDDPARDQEEDRRAEEARHQDRSSDRPRQSQGEGGQEVPPVRRGQGPDAGQGPRHRASPPPWRHCGKTTPHGSPATTGTAGPRRRSAITTPASSSAVPAATVPGSRRPARRTPEGDRSPSTRASPSGWRSRSTRTASDAATGGPDCPSRRLSTYREGAAGRPRNARRTPEHGRVHHAARPERARRKSPPAYVWPTKGREAREPAGAAPSPATPGRRHPRAPSRSLHMIDLFVRLLPGRRRPAGRQPVPRHHRRRDVRPAHRPKTRPSSWTPTPGSSSQLIDVGETLVL